MPKKPKSLTSFQLSGIDRLRIDIDNRARAIKEFDKKLVERNLEIANLKIKIAAELGGGTWVSDTLYDPKGNVIINQL